MLRIAWDLTLVALLVNGLVWSVGCDRSPAVRRGGESEALNEEWASFFFPAISYLPATGPAKGFQDALQDVGYYVSLLASTPITAKEAEGFRKAVDELAKAETKVPQWAQTWHDAARHSVDIAKGQFNQARLAAKDTPEANAWPKAYGNGAKDPQQQEATKYSDALQQEAVAINNAYYNLYRFFEDSQTISSALNPAIEDPEKAKDALERLKDFFKDSQTINSALNPAPEDPKKAAEALERMYATFSNPPVLTEQQQGPEFKRAKNNMEAQLHDTVELVNKKLNEPPYQDQLQNQIDLLQSSNATLVSSIAGLARANQELESIIEQLQAERGNILVELLSTALLMGAAGLAAGFVVVIPWSKRYADKEEYWIAITGSSGAVSPIKAMLVLVVLAMLVLAGYLVWMTLR